MVKVIRHSNIVSELLSLLPEEEDLRPLLRMQTPNQSRVAQAFWTPWVSAADVLVFNVGQHYHVIDPEFVHHDAFARGAVRALAAIMKPTAHLVVRTNNVGHPNCETARQPQPNHLIAFEELTPAGDNPWAWPPLGGASAPHKSANGSSSQHLQPTRTPATAKDPFNWRAAPLHDGAWGRAVTLTTLASRFAYLNVSFIDLRADGHVADAMRHGFDVHGRNRNTDCLHYCFPGPADFWARAMVNLLLNNERYAPR